MQTSVIVFSLVFLGIAVYVVYFYVLKPRPAHSQVLKIPFPDSYRKILQSRVLFYKNLPPERYHIHDCCFNYLQPGSAYLRKTYLAVSFTRYDCADFYGIKTVSLEAKPKV